MAQTTRYYSSKITGGEGAKIVQLHCWLLLQDFVRNVANFYNMMCDIFYTIMPISSKMAQTTRCLL